MGLAQTKLALPYQLQLFDIDLLFIIQHGTTEITQRIQTGCLLGDHSAASKASRRLPSCDSWLEEITTFTPFALAF